MKALIWIWGIIVAEIMVVLAGFLLCFVKRKRINPVCFLLASFFISLALYIFPQIITENEIKWTLSSIEFWENVTHAIRTFVGEGDIAKIKEYASSLPKEYTIAYIFGAIISMGTTIIAALQVFSINLVNKLRVFFAMHKIGHCDIVLGTSENALHYASDGAAVLIPEDTVDKDGILRLIEQGYFVLNKSYSSKLLKTLSLTPFTTYNIICPGDTEKNLDHIDTFITYNKNEKISEKIRLFVEIDEDKARPVRHEIIDKSNCRRLITTFSSNELLARKFAEEHPITQYLPRSFIENDTSIKPDTTINIIYLGFGPLNREMFRQSLINNQLVTYRNNEYENYPISYHLFGQGIDKNDWLINGLDEELGKNRGKEDYFTLPALPYVCSVYEQDPSFKETRSQIEKLVRGNNAFTYIIVDAGDTYKNIETGTRIRNLLNDENDYHIFIHSESAYTEDDRQITYLGDVDDIFNHNTIVNDGLLKTAYKYNEIYTIRNNDIPEKEARKKAEKDWGSLNYFTRYSNLYAGLNMRLKLHLLGLDYQKNANKKHFDPDNNANMIREYFLKDVEDVNSADFQSQNKRNAICAQEKYRWNAYHLIKEVLPIPKSEIKLEEKVDENGDKYIKAIIKNDPITKHGCITTYAGLIEITKYLQDRKKKDYPAYPVKEDDFDYYKNDAQFMDMLVDLMNELNYSIVKKTDQ